MYVVLDGTYLMYREKHFTYVVKWDYSVTIETYSIQWIATSMKYHSYPFVY